MGDNNYFQKFNKYFSYVSYSLEFDSTYFVPFQVVLHTARLSLAPIKKNILFTTVSKQKNFMGDLY